MNNTDIKAFIKEHSALFWYIKEAARENISLNLLVETILQYGEIPDIKRLFELVGTEKVAEIFFKQISRSRCNYHPETKNFFTQYFKRNALGSINHRTR